MKVTRTIFAETPKILPKVCKVAGFIRADIWRRYGALGTVGKNATQIRSEINAGAYYKDLLLDGTIRSETTKDIVNDVLLYKAAAKDKVKKAIFARTDAKDERKRMFTALKSDQWLSDSFLHRTMRKHFKHGVSHTDNQFIVRSDRHTESIIEGKLVITIRVAKKYGADIELVTTTSGTNVDLNKCNLRIIVKGDVTEVHYAADKTEGRIPGDQALGIDKGYTEAFTDSDGDFHGEGFGKAMTGYSDKVAKTNKNKNKLYALEKRHRKAGRTGKADRVKKNNLGRKKVDARKELTQKQLRNIAFKAAHSIVDKAALIASEDLTSPIASKKPWKKFNRRMSGWAKGVLAEAIDSVCMQREASHTLVNCAYTSQMDSTTGLLEGKRSGDRFYRENGDVLQADHNAALNVLARLSDKDIGRFTPFKEVRRILLARSPAELTVNRLELQPKGYQPSADKPNAQLCASI